ncbi:OmpA family protein [Sphingomonas parva]|uniref:OmpA family protein n=1 Tax=Sphingomonas parva TaxID=2555898 RepID=A0A4Y8ZQR5_9SPHN|nr:OmpA family protein [Sphingomonas parva]TFI57622.1 OmpA family protein [Sphingomonas parva]
MKTLFLAFVAVSGVAAGSAFAQQPAVSEEEARCFVTGVCKVGEEKDWSVANLNSKKRSTPQATPVQPTGTTQAPKPRKPIRTARNDRVRPAIATNRQSLNMRLNFELESAQLTPAATAQADVFAKVLKESASAPGRFVIEGHTDSSGSRAHNQDLSRRRAQTVVSYLVAQGVPAAKLKAVGYGFNRPLDGQSAANPGNRRVEIVKQ